MKILHDYNFDELQKVASGLWEDFCCLNVACERLRRSCTDLANEEVVVLLERVTDFFRQRSLDLDTVLSHIQRQEVPAEGREDIMVMFGLPAGKK